jgi:hypothetical protein
MASKKARLPKDFDALLSGGDLRALQAVFDACDVNARGGYGQQTALGFAGCPDELARWLVARGADLTAPDTWGNTPLHSRAESRRCGIDVLLELGAPVDAVNAARATPLHAAAGVVNVASAAKLIARGADVDARNRDGLTPLELALQRCSNVDIPAMLELARLLLGAGARRTPGTASSVEAIGKRFEAHRAAFAKDGVEAASAGLEALYALFEVPPVPRRSMHDGTSPITVTATTWQERHAELWDLLVPSSGSAATVQGEVIRITGRISHELEDDGGGNWDEEYRSMARAFLDHVRSGTPLRALDIADARSIVHDLVHAGRGDTDRLAELAVAWVVLNPAPVALARPGYRR